MIKKFIMSDYVDYVGQMGKGQYTSHLFFKIWLQDINTYTSQSEAIRICQNEAPSLTISRKASLLDIFTSEITPLLASAIIKTELTLLGPWCNIMGMYQHANKAYY